MTENQNNQKETKVEDDKVMERFINVKATAIAVGVAGVGGFILGNKRGLKHGYIQGLKDGVIQGLAEGQLEGYVKAFSDVASVLKTTEE